MFPWLHAIPFIGNPFPSLVGIQQNRLGAFLSQICLHAVESSKRVGREDTPFWVRVNKGGKDVTIRGVQGMFTFQKPISSDLTRFVRLMNFDLEVFTI